MQISFWKIIKKYKMFKTLVIEFNRLYHLTKESLGVLGKDQRFEDCLKKIWFLKKEIFGDGKSFWEDK